MRYDKILSDSKFTGEVKDFVINLYMRNYLVQLRDFDRNQLSSEFSLVVHHQRYTTNILSRTGCKSHREQRKESLLFLISESANL